MKLKSKSMYQLVKIARRAKVDVRRSLALASRTHGAAARYYANIASDGMKLVKAVATECLNRNAVPGMEPFRDTTPWKKRRVFTPIVNPNGVLVSVFGNDLFGDTVRVPVSFTAH